MSLRHMKRACAITMFTIFVLGLIRRSVPVSVRQTTTVNEVYGHLGDAGLVPSSGRDCLYFVVNGRRASWEDDVKSLNLGPMSHLHLRVALPGGVKDDPSSARGKHKHTEARMQGSADAQNITSGVSSPSGEWCNSIPLLPKEVLVFDSDDERGFDAAEWIGTGKRFQDVPLYVSPRRLPEVLADSTPFPRRTTDWFSSDLPNYEPDRVWTIVIPPLSFVRDLENVFAQAWLNGVKSLVDPNDKSLRLPLWALQFYREVIALHPVLESSTIIAFLSFQTEIKKFATQGPPGWNLKRFLSRYLDEIRAGKTKMYLPLHANNKHWVAFMIDFERKVFGYACVVWDTYLAHSDCTSVRLDWFKKFMHRAGIAPGDDTASVETHENYDFYYDYTEDSIVPPPENAIPPLPESSPRPRPPAMSILNLLNPDVLPSATTPIADPPVATLEVPQRSRFAKGCQGVTSSLSHTFSACTTVGHLPGLQRVVRRARAKAQLPLTEFTKSIGRKFTFTLAILSEHAAAKAKANLAKPAVVKLLTSKAMYGPMGAFLSLFQQAQQGDLDDHETFVATCGKLSDSVKHKKDPTDHAIHGIRHDPTFIKFCALARSYGPRSGAQYDFLTSMTGGISQTQFR
ncbi:hypothetical protein DFH09DRAFT_1289591 [Mycena vulgaris]|nr:hypothetical protein DFH09DRAFT_1289591 [Mycena vulgaris]